MHWDQDKSDRRIVRTSCRWITWAYLFCIGFLGLLPSENLGSIYVFSGRINTQAVQSLVLYISIILLLACFLAFFWRKDVAGRLNMTWPLFFLLCGYIIAMLLLVFDEFGHFVYDLVKYDAPAWLHIIASSMDVSHSIMYSTITLFALIGWRGRLAPIVIAILLCGYGLLIEMIQEFVPTRSFQIADLISNCAGVLVALLAAGLAGDSPRTHARLSHPQQGGMQ